MVDYESMRVYIIPYLSDNYSYILEDKDSGLFCIIDGASHEAVLATVDHYGLDRSKMMFILTTHKHWDHAGGNDELAKAFEQPKVLGSAIDNPYGTTDHIKD